MTDTTDIAALKRPVRDRYDWSNAVWRDCDQCGKQHTGTVTAEDGSQICAHCADQLYWSAWQVLAERALDNLEAERQRAERAKSALDSMTRQRDEVERLRVVLCNDKDNLIDKCIERDKEIAAMKGDQVPVAWLNQCGPFGGVVTISPTIAHSWEMRGDDVTPLFTPPAKACRH